jgi:hypothetical protein
MLGRMGKEAAIRETHRHQGGAGGRTRTGRPLRPSRTCIVISSMAAPLSLQAEVGPRRASGGEELSGVVGLVMGVASP